MAEVDCSGSSRKPVVSRTPIFSSGWSSANSLVWSSRFGTRRIAERISRAAILLVEQIANVRRIFARDAQLFAHLLVQIFGQGFGGFHAQPVQIEILGVLSGFEQLLRLYRCPGAHCDQRQPDHIHLSRRLLGAKKSEMESLRPSRWRGKVKRKSSPVYAVPALCPAHTRSRRCLRSAPGNIRKPPSAREPRWR